MKLTAEAIQCQPIDTVKLDHDINENLHKSHPEFPANKVFSVRGKFAIVREPKLSLIDEEFCGCDLTDRVELGIYSEEMITEPNGNKHGTVGIFAEFEERLTLLELEPYLLPLVTLAEFTKGRRGYNGRIKANENEWMRHFNKED
jgi:hypothetical protein